MVEALVKGLGGTNGSGFGSRAALLLARDGREVQRRRRIARIQLYGGTENWKG